jgi:peroxin-13
MHGGGGMYGRMGYGMNTGVSTNRFVRLAEESSRPAFESLESIVQAVGSISMVLESTFFAVNSSFRAVIGLADHFSRLRTQFSTIISTFTVIRTLRYLYRKVLYMLGICKGSPVEDAWVEAKADNIVKDIKKNKSSWPVLLFFVIVLGGPYLIWKLLHSFMNSDGKCEETYY